MNKYENMEIKNICCEDCLFGELLEKVEKLSEWENITLFAKSDLMEYIVSKFIGLSEFSVGIINFDSCNNEMEYVMTITEEKYVYCEPARVLVNGKPTLCNYDVGVSYVYQEDVKQDIIDGLLNDNCDVVLFGLGEEDIEQEDEKLHGFTISNSSEDGIDTYTFYCTDHDVMLQELKRFRETK